MTERDPMAEIARLRLPAGPHLHLLDGAPADARALGWMLATVGLVTRALRGPCMRTAFGLYDEIGAAVQLPGDPVEDWPDIGALLVDLSWLPADGHVLVVTDAALVLAAEPASFAAWCGMIDDVAHRRTAELDIGSPRPFHVVLQDDPSGLAGLRARLSEAAVSYDELLGWERQEPARSPGGAGVRVSYQPGDAGLDGIDRAAGAAIGQRPDVLEVRRAVQVFRADTRTRVRVYGAVLNRFDRVGEVTRELADAVAPSGAQLMVMSDIVAARGPRQEAFLAAAGLVWPLPAEPATDPEQPEPALPEPAQPEQAEGSEPEQSEQAERPEPELPEPGLPEPELPEQPSTVDESVDRQTASSRPDGGADPTAFQIVAADLGWSYEPGRPEHDPVDSALCLLGADQPLIAGLWRCWCVRPDDGGYVRTVLASTHRGPLEADLVRRQVVDTLRDAGAGECCAEVVPGSDVGDVHAWLRDQSTLLLGPRAAPTDPARPPDPPGPPDRSDRPDPPDAAALLSTATFERGPDEPGQDGERLIAWATDRAGVVGLVRAHAVIGGSRRTVYGVVAESNGDVDILRAEGTDVLEAAGAGGEAGIVVAFSTSTKLGPAYLRLYRGSTRLWRPKVDRAASPHPGGARPVPSLSATEQVVLPVTDETFDNGVTFAVVDRTVTTFEPGAEEPTALDFAVTAWASAQEHAIAVVSGVAVDGDARMPAYLVMLDAPGEEGVIRAGLAAAIGAETVDTRCMVGVFCPFSGDIDSMYTALFAGGRRRWRTDRTVDPAAAAPDDAVRTPSPEGP